MRNRPSVSQNQDGLVAIIVTMIFMVIISLIVIGFSQQSRRESRQALDRQLASQASYAAESGINDARKEIANGYTANRTSCGFDAPGGVFTAARADLGNNTSYSCLLINRVSGNLLYNVATSKSSIFPLKAEGGVAINSMKIVWAESTGASTVPGSYPNFPVAGSWANGPGIMRVDLIPADLIAPDNTRAGLINDTFTAFLYPSTGGVNTYALASGTGSANAGAVVETKCDAAGTCSMEITGLSKTDYYVRLKSIYRPNTATITITQAGGAPVNVEGVQVIIDSTGRAGDVLKRIQVRVPVAANTYMYPEFALETTNDICKKLSVAPGSGLDGCTP